MCGKPADPQIYQEATYRQEPRLEAQLVKLDYLIIYQDRGSNITRLKTASNCSISPCCLGITWRQLSTLLYILISAYI
jgi:hypothetical protein